MTITLYQNVSEANVVDKTLLNGIEVSGTLREGTSVLNPSLTINTNAENIVWVNYIYIHEWNRYYFVNDIVSVRTGMWGFSCHVDVLMTYRTQLRQQSAIIARQENLYNLYLDDDKFLVNAPRMVVTKAFPNRVQAGNVEGALSFILTLAGGARDETT